MTWYKCRLIGENFPGQRFGMQGLAGFYATRTVEAESLAQLEQRVLALMDLEPMLMPPPAHDRANDARIGFEQVCRVSEQEGRAARNAGFTVFQMERDAP